MTKYILVEWPYCQQFMEHEDCIPGCDGEVWFVPEELFKLTFNRTASYEYVNEKIEDIRQLIRQTLSRILADTSENCPMNCYIEMECPETSGLSSLLIPHITKIWQEPSLGIITFIYEDSHEVDFDMMNTDDLLIILKGLEDAINNNALNIENSEYNYGHNVNHNSEEV